MTEKIKCECGTEWKIAPNKSAYKGEIVLYCENCGETHYNAQKEFSNETIEKLKKL